MGNPLNDRIRGYAFIWIHVPSKGYVGTPHLNGKVERSQKTDLEEFYPTVDLKAADLENLLSEWQHLGITLTKVPM